MVALSIALTCVGCMNGEVLVDPDQRQAIIREARREVYVFDSPSRVTFIEPTGRGKGGPRNREGAAPGEQPRCGQCCRRAPPCSHEGLPHVLPGRMLREKRATF